MTVGQLTALSARTISSNTLMIKPYSVDKRKTSCVHSVESSFAPGLPTLMKKSCD